MNWANEKIGLEGLSNKFPNLKRLFDDINSYESIYDHFCSKNFYTQWNGNSAWFNNVELTKPFYLYCECKFKPEKENECIEILKNSCQDHKKEFGTVMLNYNCTLYDQGYIYL